MSTPPLRILLAALGGEGGGVLMNWIVEAARTSGRQVQATSVPGVAQRTGSTSYYIEIGAETDAPQKVLSLVPMPGRVDVVLSSELVETARVMSAGFVSPGLTTLISSTARHFTTAEKIAMGDGRYSEETLRATAEDLAKTSILLDLGALATEAGTFVSATMYGALTGSGVLPWSTEHARSVLGDARSEAGFDAAIAAVADLEAEAPVAPVAESARASDLPDSLRMVLEHGIDRTTDFQDADYGALFSERAQTLVGAADLDDHRALHAVTEGCRRLALWMAYEDIARVADLKTRPERFERIRAEIKLQPGQVLTVTEFMKPRAEEIADMLPKALGARMQARAERGGWFPFLGKGRYIRSNGVVGYAMLRAVARLKSVRRRSLRFATETAAIEEWLAAMQTALARSPEFAMGLGELPRVLKGYSDTLVRGKEAYARIMDHIVRPAISEGREAECAKMLRDAIGAALADDSHDKLNGVLNGTAPVPEIPKLRQVANV